MRSYYYALSLAIAILFNSGSAQAQCATSALSVYDITSDSASLFWATASGVPDFEYTVLPASAATPTTGTVNAGGAAIRVGGLSIGTAYKAWLRSHCGSGVYTPWVAISFSTPCGTPSTINVTNIYGDSAKVSWTAVGPSTKYEYVVDTVATAPTGAGTATTSNTVTVKGLMASKIYYVFVRTSCTSTFSAWSGGQSFFSAFSTGISITAANNIRIYPNPVTDKLYINGLQGNTTLSIHNTMGSTVFNTTIQNTDVTIDMTPYAAGMYIIKHNNGITTGILKVEKH